MGLTNAYNFMDGIDGIAGGQAVDRRIWVGNYRLYERPIVCWPNWRALSRVQPRFSYSTTGLPLEYLWGMWGALLLDSPWPLFPFLRPKGTPRCMVAGILMVWPFIFDASFTLVRRLINKENIFVAHRSHIYQRLVIAGYSHRFVTLIYMGLALIGTVIALLWYIKSAFC